MKMPPARATGWIVGITGAIWLIIWAGNFGNAAAWSAGLVPARFGHPEIDAQIVAQLRLAGYANVFLLPVWLTPLSSAFTHVQFFHVAFNLAMIGFCGRFVEAGLGERGFVLLYIVGALVAALFQYLWDPAGTAPMIGASGAGSAVIAAYALLYGAPKPFTGRRRLDRAINVLWLAAMWIGLQAMVGFAGSQLPVAIAFAAHIGGFLAGLALARPLLLWRYRNA